MVLRWRHAGYNWISCDHEKLRALEGKKCGRGSDEVYGKVLV
jgi:hypothetical protein